MQQNQRNGVEELMKLLLILFTFRQRKRVIITLFFILVLGRGGVQIQCDFVSFKWQICS